MAIDLHALSNGHWSRDRPFTLPTPGYFCMPAWSSNGSSVEWMDVEIGIARVRVAVVYWCAHGPMRVGGVGVGLGIAEGDMFIVHVRLCLCSCSCSRSMCICPPLFLFVLYFCLLCSLNLYCTSNCLACLGHLDYLHLSITNRFSTPDHHDWNSCPCPCYCTVTVTYQLHSKLKN